MLNPRPPERPPPRLFQRIGDWPAPMTALILTILGPSACASSLSAASAPESGSDTAGLVGNPAPDFTMDPLQGARAPVSIRALRGQVVVVDFWGTYCAPCKASFPKLQGLSAKYAPSGLRIVGVSEDEDDDKGKIAPFAAQYGAKFTIGWDKDHAIAQRYKPETMPSTFLIDRRGVVRYAHVGYRDGDDAELEKEIRELLSQ